MKRIVFWQPGLSVHWSPVIRALAERNVFDEVVLVANEGLTEKQKAIGKYAPDFGRAKVVIAPTDAQCASLIAESPETSTHIFTAFRSYPAVTKGFDACLKTNARMGVFAEPGDHRGIKGMIRRAKRWTESVKFGSRLSFIIATGDMGIRWFRSCGFSDKVLYKFAYFVEGASSVTLPAAPNSQVHIVFIGQLIPRKGIDLLLTALNGLKDKPWRLTIAGAGANEAELKALAQSFGMTDRVEFIKALPNKEAIQLMASGDMLILPSRFDGWGAVVNEALMVGVPVICSDACGAADLLSQDERGAVFPSENTEKLAQVLANRIDRGPRKPAEREALKNWADCIRAETAATYLVDILHSAAAGSAHPVAPWDAKR